MAKENTELASSEIAENFSLADFMGLEGKNFRERLNIFYNYLNEETSRGNVYYMREACGAAGREVKIKDPSTGEIRNMLMFGSNNYLGFANHPYIIKKVQEAIEKFGIGIGGPPLLNGTTSLHKQLAQRLAKIKNKELAVIFPTGYSANVGLVSALIGRKDIVIFDELCHASFIDGLALARIKFRSYKHNDMNDLKDKLEAVVDTGKDIFVATEGVFSMDGDIGRLDEIIALKNRYNFTLIVDDSHGLGVMGDSGHGMHEYFHTDGIDIIMGTFSKTLAMTGGFIAANKEIASYLQYFARSYIFSASLPPTTIAAVLAGLELLDTEKWRIQTLKEKVSYFVNLLREKGIEVKTDSAIISILVPANINIRKASKIIHDQGIFINTIEFPAVPLKLQRFRVSIMSEHTRDDMERLADVLAQVLCA